MKKKSDENIVRDWIRNNPGVTLSFAVIFSVSLSTFLYFFLAAR